MLQRCLPRDAAGEDQDDGEKEDEEQSVEDTLEQIDRHGTGKEARHGSVGTVYCGIALRHPDY